MIEMQFFTVFLPPNGHNVDTQLRYSEYSENSNFILIADSFTSLGRAQ